MAVFFKTNERGVCAGNMPGSVFFNDLFAFKQNIIMVKCNYNGQV